MHRVDPRRVLMRLVVGFGLLVTIDVGLQWRSTINGLGTTTSVVEVRRDVDAGSSLSPDDVDVVDWPRALLPDGVVSTLPADAVTRSDLFAGELLIEGRLFQTGIGLEAGERLVTLPMPGAPPPVYAGTRVELYGIRSLGDDLTTQATRLTTGIVVELTDVSIAVAIPEAAVPIVLDHLAFGVVDVVALP